MNRLKLVGVAVAVGLNGTAVGDVVFVPDDYPSVHEAVVAANGDTSHWTIWVRPGAWLSFSNIDQPLLLISTDGADVTSIGGSLLIQGDNVTVQGFTVTNNIQGQAQFTTNRDCMFDGTKLMIGSDAVVTGCTFVGSTTGAIVMAGGGATVMGCTFIGNSVTSNGGAILGRLDSTIIDCVFDGNTADSGGAIFWSGGDANTVPKISNCSFRNNTATLFGGAIYIEQSSPLITNCLMTGNEATFGGAIFNAQGFKLPTLVNCTVAGNVATVGGAIVNDDFVVLTIWNSIVWFNGDQIVGDPLSATEAMFSNIELAQFAGPGTISSDPLFVNLANGDVRLGAGSPSIDAGHNWAVPSDSIDLDQDADTTELIPLDLDGNPRFADDAATTDTGCGASAVVDMGAYEFPGNPLACLRPGDVNGDTVVNVLDLIDLLLAFGASCEVECCLADFNIDGSVDVLDLIALLLAFGTACPCPE